MQSSSSACGCRSKTHDLKKSALPISAGRIMQKRPLNHSMLRSIIRQRKIVIPWVWVQLQHICLRQQDECVGSFAL